jgi:peptidoglycan/LPS O-acetylase OafA/YrhL
VTDTAAALSTPATATRPTRIQGLDALRGAAVLLVVLRHAWPGLFGGAGVVGVTMFFALSGFLITDLIASEVARTGRLSFGRFYRHRAFRLLPALLVLLTVYAVVEGATGRGADAAPLTSVVVGAMYLADLPAVHLGAGLGHLWTLAVEEQFYLVWPALLVVAVRRNRVASLLLGAALVPLAVTAFALGAVADASTLYERPTSWAVTLVIGAAAALHRGRLSAALRRPRLAATLAAGFLGVVSFLPDAKSRPATYLLLAPLIAGSTVVLVLAAVRSERLPGQWQWLRRIGLVSYSAYLWNLLIVVWLRGPRNLGSTHHAVTSVVLTFVAAALSWVLVEQPAQRLRRRVASRVT